MSQPSSRLIQGFLRLHRRHHQLHLPKSCPSNAHSSSHFATSTFDPFARFSSSSSLTRSIPFSNSSSSASCYAQNSCQSRAFGNFAASEIVAPSRAAHVYHRTGQALSKSSSPAELGQLRLNCYGVRHFSFKSSGNGGFAKKVFEKPAMSVLSTFSKYREALGLQVESFLRSNYLFLVGAVAVLVCALLWRIMFGIANAFVGISEGLAKYGFLALSSAIVAFAGLYLRSRLTINPDRIYRMAMRKLNTHAGILEVMGAPLTGSDLRAYVMSGSGVTFKKFKPRLRGKRCFLLFPIRGSERKGLVSVEVKKKKGQYDVKLLAVDVPMSSGPDQRLFVIGDEEEYKVGGGLISELRDPVLKAMAATKEFDHLDEIEEEEDAERELQEAEKKHREEIEKLEKAGQE
ncbi:uncharacterized protein LOC115743610 [Rhodamnia argentea]|uniref:Uncharacterized protein LOC115743610 n=1 Tax=Rhodamnia argentea TaxID=178133 RepID=A0A8B8PHP4_9MYRT|nr:uncharacterized protein LOC115743610 [Rhodamnia argentea]